MLDRRNKILKELEAYANEGNTATYPYYFRGERKYLEVIKINPNYLTLNHKNNRLTGQLSDHPKKNLVLADPTSVEAQDVLTTLLARTEKFKELKDQLQILGQKEPGLITRDGLLVNGNTRVAALRQLGVGFVEVAVLPDNVDESDILNLEMKLQVNNLVHQNYSFTNELLFMRKFLDAGYSNKELAKEMSWVRGGERKVKLHMRLLDYIEDVRSLSVPPIPYSAFDSKGQHLKDLDSEYLALKDEGDIAAAESLKWTRLSMIFLNLNKDQVRAVDVGFIEELVLPRLEDDPDEKEAAEYLSEFIDDFQNDDGLGDLLDDENQDAPTVNMKSFLKKFLNDPDQRVDSGDVATDLTGIYSTISVASRRVSDRIIDNQKVASLKAKPTLILKEMREGVATLRENVPELKGTEGFDLSDFKFHYKKLREELDKLQSVIAE